MGFSIGPWEILLIFVVIIIVVGPHRLPEIARTLGKAFRAVRKAGADLSAGITRELEDSKKETLPPDKPSAKPKKDDLSPKTGGQRQKNE
jgi:Tat protein translocase TatB subunit